MSKINFSVRLLSVAEEDLGEIFSFIASDNTNDAANLADKIEKNLELLSENPSVSLCIRAVLQRCSFSDFLLLNLRCYFPCQIIVFCLFFTRP